jgi:transcriptional regulator with XRE-family HTH domain
MIVASDGDAAPSSVDALCDFAGWSRVDLAERLGIGERVLSYYESNGGPRWLTHALVGIAVTELGLTAENARAIVGVPRDSNSR